MKKENADYFKQLKQFEKENKLQEAIIIGEQQEINRLEKVAADLQQRLDWAQGFLDKDAEYDELNKLRKENAELKEYIEKYNKHSMTCFAADMVYKALNPKSTMCTPNCVYIKMEAELENWSK